MFWRLSPPEIYAALEAYEEKEHRTDLRAGLIASTLININSKEGSPTVHPEDFFRRRPKAEDYMTVEEAKMQLDAWAKAHNADFAANEEVS